MDPRIPHDFITPLSIVDGKSGEKRIPGNRNTKRRTGTPKIFCCDVKIFCILRPGESMEDHFSVLDPMNVFGYRLRSI